MYPVAGMEIGAAAGIAEKAEAGTGGKGLGIGRHAFEQQADFLQALNRRLLGGVIPRQTPGDGLQHRDFGQWPVQRYQGRTHQSKGHDLVGDRRVGTRVDQREGHPGRLQGALGLRWIGLGLGDAEGEPGMRVGRRILADPAHHRLQGRKRLLPVIRLDGGIRRVAGALQLFLGRAARIGLLQFGREGIRIGLQAWKLKLRCGVALCTRNPQGEGDQQRQGETCEPRDTFHQTYFPPAIAIEISLSRGTTGRVTPKYKVN
jgi:hypothetical protein